MGRGQRGQQLLLAAFCIDYHIAHRTYPSVLATNAHALVSRNLQYHWFRNFPPGFFKPKTSAYDLTSGFFGQLAQAHLPGSHGHAPVEPPQSHFVLSGFSLTFSMFAISASEPEAVLVSGFFGQSAHAHFPGWQPHLPVSA